MSRTKDRYRRQERETERLIRESPKIRPPRKDRRRERVEEDDPDLGGDSDLSMNYKDIGGSLQSMANDLGRLSRKMSSIFPDVSRDLNLVKTRLRGAVGGGMFDGMSRRESLQTSARMLHRLKRLARGDPDRTP